MDEIYHILDGFSEENMQEIFNQIINSDTYKLTPVGVCGVIVSYFSHYEASMRNEIMSQFLKFLFQNVPDPKLDVQLFFLLLWIRSSDEQALDYQINCLEELAPQLHEYEFENKGINTFCHLAIAQLMERCQNYILPSEDCNLTEPLPSKEFLEKSSDLIRSKRAATYRGRLHMITTRIFPAFASFAMSKNCVPLEFERGDLPIGVYLQRIASPSNLSSTDFKMIATYLNKVNCVEYKNRVKRIPSRVLTSLDSLQNQSSVQDPEVCLQIAIMCLILEQSSQEGEQNESQFAPLVLKFSEMCHVDGLMIINTVKRAESTYLKIGTLDASYDISNLTEEVSQAPEKPFTPLLSSFEIEPEQNGDTTPDFSVIEDDALFDKESARKQIISFAGDDEEKWFAGNGINEWRAARMCVSHFMDRLDSKSISLIPENE